MFDFIIRNIHDEAIRHDVWEIREIHKHVIWNPCGISLSYNSPNYNRNRKNEFSRLCDGFECGKEFFCLIELLYMNWDGFYSPVISHTVEQICLVYAPPAISWPGVMCATHSRSPTSISVISFPSSSRTVHTTSGGAKE